MKTRRLVIRIAAVLVLVVIGVVMGVIGRGHTIYLDNKSLDYEGQSYKAPYKITVTAGGEQVDVVLMDPPRAGSSEEFLESLAACAPARAVYISCNPETQARDVRQLERRGYRLRTLQPVDMFPHTDHIETVALLEREGGR